MRRTHFKFLGFILVLAASAGASPRGTAQTLDEIHQGFMATYDSLNDNRDGKIEKLSTSYKRALRSFFDETKRASKLDPLVAIRSEITAIETGADPLENLPKSSPKKLVEMRRKFVKAQTAIINDHATKLTALASKTVEFLKRRETQLTKQGDVDTALLARRMRESLERDAAISTARTVSEGRSRAMGSLSEYAEISPQKGFVSIAELKDNAKAWSNRRYKWVNVPDELPMKRFTMIPGGGKATITARVESPGYLFIAFSHPDHATLRRKGWKATEYSFNYTDPGLTKMHVLKKQVAEGDLELENLGWAGPVLLLP